MITFLLAFFGVVFGIIAAIAAIPVALTTMGLFMDWVLSVKDEKPSEIGMIIEKLRKRYRKESK